MRTAVLLWMASACWAQVRLPPYTRTVLPNGIVLCLAPRHNLPLVEFQATIKGGAESDGKGRAGLAALTADLLDRGTRTRSARQFAADLDRIGATLSAAVDEQSTTVSLSCLSSDVIPAVELLSDALLHATFPAAEVSKEVARAVDDARAEKDAPASAVWDYFSSFFFGPRHPYGRPSWGDELSLRRITRNHLAGYYRRMYAGSNLILVVAGDFDAARMRAQLSRAFAAMPRGVGYRWRADPPAPRPAASRLLLVDKPDAAQTNLLIGLPGIRRTDPDRVPLWLADTALGGSFTSLLNQALRVDHGLAYGAYAWMDQNRLAGAIVLSTATPTSETGKGAGLMLGVLRRFWRDGITAEQLQRVKRYLKGTWPADNLQTAGEVAGLIGDLELYRLGRDEVDRLFERVDAVTLQQVNAVVRKYFRPEDLSFVVVGNAARIRAALAGYATDLRQVSIAQPGFPVRSVLQQARR